MLLQADIENLITLQKTRLDFFLGTTVITGDTGAGKSILLGAILLALGERSSDQMIRQNSDRADITLCFDISRVPNARHWLLAHDLNTDECILRRVLSRDGRTRSYINGIPVPLTHLRELGEHLLHLHGQHAQQSILRPESQLEHLDLFASHTHLQKEVLKKSKIFHTLQHKITALTSENQKNLAHQEWLAFQLSEFENLHIQPDGFAELDKLHRQLSHAESLLQQTVRASGLLSENEENARNYISEARLSLESVQHADNKIAHFVNTLKNIMIEIDDISAELKNYTEKTEQDPARLATVESRISQLFNLARKYKIQPEELYSYQENLSTQLNKNQNSDKLLRELSEQLENIKKEYISSAEKLSESRKKTAKKLSKIVTVTLHQLALPHAEFIIDFEPQNNFFSSEGLEKAVFKIRTNAGAVLKPLAGSVSGGELSRLSLALCAATGKQHTIPSLVFDEIDTGIGGGTAETIGKLLRQLGENHQVLCVTHAPQVASQGHHHVYAEKIQTKQETRTDIRTLSDEERIQEIARMLGGVEITGKTRALSREMIKRAQGHEMETFENKSSSLVS